MISLHCTNFRPRAIVLRPARPQIRNKILGREIWLGSLKLARLVPARKWMEIQCRVRTLYGGDGENHDKADAPHASLKIDRCGPLGTSRACEHGSGPVLGAEWLE